MDSREREVMTIRIGIVEPRRLMGQLLHHLLHSEADMTVVGVYPDERGLLSALNETELDVLLYAVTMAPPAAHVHLLSQVKEVSPRTQVVAMVGERQDHLLPVLARAGVTGHISERAEASDVVRAIRAAGEGIPSISQDLALRLLDEAVRPQSPDVELTPREHSVLTGIIEGDSNRAIAERLGLSEKTVKNHVTSVFNKLGVRDRTQAAIYALQAGLVTDSRELLGEPKQLAAAHR